MMKMWSKFMLFLAILPFCSQAQTLTGMSGLLNSPTADMQTDGTFIMGVNCLPKINMPTGFSPYSYNGNYYFNLTFLPFLEAAYKLTLIKTPEITN